MQGVARNQSSHAFLDHRIALGYIRASCAEISSLMKQLKNQNVLLLGFGKSGQSAARLLLSQEARLTIVDDRLEHQEAAYAFFWQRGVQHMAAARASCDMGLFDL